MSYFCSLISCVEESLKIGRKYSCNKGLKLYENGEKLLTIYLKNSIIIVLWGDKIEKKQCYKIIA